MDKLKKRLSYLQKTRSVQKQWDSLAGEETLSTRSKLEKLVSTRLKNKPIAPGKKSSPPPSGGNEPYFSKEYLYPVTLDFNGVRLGDYPAAAPEEIRLLFPSPLAPDLDPRRVVFFDTETTGLAGGTGTIPFMLGFGYFEDEFFKVKTYILGNPAREAEFLEEVDRFLQEKGFSYTVTYNGRGFDFPLMETRYLLQRKRFPLLTLPHLDLLFISRMVWKHTYESRKLGYLGDILLGISREEDVLGYQIPGLYFEFLREGRLEAMDRICEHNSMDLVGLLGLLILVLGFLRDEARVKDPGEALGIARLLELRGRVKRAEAYYRRVVREDARPDLTRRALLHLSLIKKRSRCFSEAKGLWERLLDFEKPFFAYRELAMVYEHRERNLQRALDLVTRALETGSLNDFYRQDFIRRKERLLNKIRNRQCRE